MLALVLRGCFLVVFISWYSQGVWKTIDGYFHDRFQKYLQEEIAKNPRLRADMKTYSAQVDKTKSSHAVKVESSTTESPGIDTTEHLSSEDRLVELTNDINQVETHVSTVDKDDVELFQRNDFENDTIVQMADEAMKIEPTVVPDDASSKRKRHKKRLAELKSKEESEPVKFTKKKKNRVNLLTLTEADFRSAKRSKDYDFSKFEVDEDENLDQEMDGILVSKLPFKPAVDLAGLKRITEDEFCPLSTADEESCGETTSWS